MNRRDFMATGAALTGAALILPRARRRRRRLRPAARRVAELRHHHPPRHRLGRRRDGAWVPLPWIEAAAWVVPEGDAWTGNAAAAEVVTDPTPGAKCCTRPSPTARRSRSSRWSAASVRATAPGPGTVVPLSDAERQLYLAATELMPTDGIVEGTAGRIIAGTEGDEAKARAIYAWVVENTARERGDAGLRDRGRRRACSPPGTSPASAPTSTRSTWRWRGASGVPSREYLRHPRGALERFGYKSLGAKNETHHKVAALPGRGLARRQRAGPPVDPADVRKVVLEEPPGGSPSTARWWWRRARSSSGRGRATGCPTTTPTTWSCRARRTGSRS